MSVLPSVSRCVSVCPVGLSGLVDILVHHGAPLPPDCQYFAGCLAFIVEAVLFTFHLHGRTQLDVITHTLLVYVIYACAVVTILEMRHRRSVIVAIARAYTVLLQVTQPVFRSVILDLVVWHSGRTSVSDWRTFPVLRSTCS